MLPTRKANAAMSSEPAPPPVTGAASSAVAVFGWVGPAVVVVRETDCEKLVVEEVSVPVDGSLPVVVSDVVGDSVVVVVSDVVGDSVVVVVSLAEDVSLPVVVSLTEELSVDE